MCRPETGHAPTCACTAHTRRKGGSVFGKGNDEEGAAQVPARGAWGIKDGAIQHDRHESANKK